MVRQQQHLSHHHYRYQVSLRMCMANLLCIKPHHVVQDEKLLLRRLCPDMPGKLEPPRGRFAAMELGFELEGGVGQPRGAQQGLEDPLRHRRHLRFGVASFVTHPKVGGVRPKTQACLRVCGI